MLSDANHYIFQIVLIDFFRRNRIIIGILRLSFHQNKEKNYILGNSDAVVLRIILTLLTAYLVQRQGIRLIGGFSYFILFTNFI